MKTVFNNSMVCHVWAQQTQEHGRSGTNSIFFEGDTIYSYGRHFPMARFVTKKNRKKKTAVLFSTLSYSVTTSKHQHKARHAIDRSKYRIFDVPSVTSHDTNIQNFYHRFRAAIQATKSARAGLIHVPNPNSTETWDSYHWVKGTGYQVALHRFKSIKPILTELKEYSDYSGLKWKFDFKSECREISAVLKHKKKIAIQAKRNAPKREKQNARKRMRTRRRKIEQYIKGETAIWNLGLNDYKLRCRIENSEIIQYKRSFHLNEKRKVERQKARTQLKVWLKGNDNGFFHHEFPIFLRVKGDMVQTTKGATVPLKFIRKAWDKIQQCRKHKSTWQRNGGRIPLGHFTVDYINPDGSIKVGCHTIKYGPIKQLARTLKYI